MAYSPEFLHINRRFEHEEYMTRVMYADLLAVFAQICVTVGAAKPFTVYGLNAPIANSRIMPH